MRYLGGKHRTAKHIAAYLESVRQPGQTFLEPFCGALNVTAKMSGERIASDAHPYLIALYNSLQAGSFVPP